MCRRLPGAVGVSLVSSGFIGAETAAITPSDYRPLADGNSETYSADGAPTLTLTVVWGATLDIMPRR